MIEMSYGFVGEDEAGKDAEAGNAFALSMEADADQPTPQPEDMR